MKNTIQKISKSAAAVACIFSANLATAHTNGTSQLPLNTCALQVSLTPDNSSPSSTEMPVFYPTNFNTISQSLKIDAPLFAKMKSAGAKVASIGEGTSGFVPGLLERNINAVGVDIIYPKPGEISPEIQGQSSDARQLRAFVRVYGSHILHGTATALPFNDESIRVLLANKVANNIHIADQLTFFFETIRVLEVGGEARITLTEAETLDFSFAKKKPYLEAIKKFLETNFGPNGIRIKFEIESSFFLKIRKISSLKPLPPMRSPYSRDVIYPYLPAVGLNTSIDRLPDWILFLYKENYPDDLFYIGAEVARRRQLNMGNAPTSNDSN